MGRRRLPLWTAIVGAVFAGWVAWGIWAAFLSIGVTLLFKLPVELPAPLWIWPAVTIVLIAVALLARRRGII